MEVFKLMIDTKVSIWKRDIVCIRADSLEEATKIAFDNNEFFSRLSKYRISCRN